MVDKSAGLGAVAANEDGRDGGVGLDGSGRDDTLPLDAGRPDRDGYGLAFGVGYDVVLLLGAGAELLGRHAALGEDRLEVLPCLDDLRRGELLAGGLPRAGALLCIGALDVGDTGELGAAGGSLGGRERLKARVVGEQVVDLARDDGGLAGGLIAAELLATDFHAKLLLFVEGALPLLLDESVLIGGLLGFHGGVEVGLFALGAGLLLAEDAFLLALLFFAKQHVDALLLVCALGFVCLRDLRDGPSADHHRRCRDHVHGVHGVVLPSAVGIFDVVGPVVEVLEVVDDKLFCEFGLGCAKHAAQGCRDGPRGGGRRFLPEERLEAPLSKLAEGGGDDAFHACGGRCIGR